jgi:serine/threonine protein kinase
LQTKTPQSIIVKLLAFNPQMQWEDVKLFEGEAQVLQHLDHPQIPRDRDSFAIDAQAGKGLPMFGLVQDYIEGKSLQELLDKNYKFPLTEVQTIAGQCLQILVYLHELSPPVLHRDIKPSNLILDGNNRLYLVDFGSVQERAKAEGVSFTVVGTGGYAPPEQLWGKAVASSDLYALGATLIYLLTGVAPASLAQSNLRIEWMDRVKVNPDFALWLNQLIDPVVEKRFPTAREALKALDIIPKDFDTNAPRSRPAIKTSARGKGLFALLSLILMMVGSIMTSYRIQKEIKSYQIRSLSYYIHVKEEINIDEVEVVRYINAGVVTEIKIKFSEKEADKLFGRKYQGVIYADDCRIGFYPDSRMLYISDFLDECGGGNRLYILKP